MANIDISVVTPSYNQGEFIGECIDSVAQSLGNGYNIEHIIVDNCSDDGTIEILKSKKSPHIRCIIEKDKGQSDAINKGVLSSKGKWVLWLNADDRITSGAIQAYMEALVVNPGCNIAYGHVRLIDSKSKPIRTCYHLPFSPKLISGNCYQPPSSGTLFKRELLLNHPLDISYHYVMDVEWYIRCVKLIEAAFLNRIQSEFRLSLSSKTSKMVESGVINEKHFNERERYRETYLYPNLPGGKFMNLKVAYRLHRLLLAPCYYYRKSKYIHLYFLQKISRLKI